MIDLEFHPKEVVVLSLDDYQKVSISFLNRLYKEGYSVSEISKEFNYVVIVR
jgi:hypothetical protein